MTSLQNNQPNAATFTAPNGATYEVKTACPTDDVLQRRLKKGIYRFEDGELLKRCSRCKEYWPADTEFFYQVKGDDGLNQWCKACYQEWRYPEGRKNADTAKRSAQS